MIEEKGTSKNKKATKKLEDKTKEKVAKTESKAKKTTKKIEDKVTSGTKKATSKVRETSEKAPKIADKVTGTYNGKKVYTGPRGGRYYINSNGNKTYISDDK